MRIFNTSRIHPRIRFCKEETKKARANSMYFVHLVSIEPETDSNRVGQRRTNNNPDDPEQSEERRNGKGRAKTI